MSTLYSDHGVGPAPTVSSLMHQPRVITELIADRLADSSVTSAVFDNATADARGGAVLYQVVAPSDVISTSDINERTEGAEYSLVTLPETKVVADPVEDLGGKFEVSDEAQERNVLPLMENNIAQLAASIMRKIDERTADVLILAADTHNLDIFGNDWTSFETRGSTPTPRAQTPIADLIAAQLSFDQDEMGVRVAKLILNPADAAALTIGYGEEIGAVLAAAAGSDTPVSIHTSARIPAGTGYVIGDTKIGGLGVEKPLTTEVIAKRENRMAIVQSYIVAKPFIQRAYAVRRLVGLAG